MLIIFVWNFETINFIVRKCMRPHEHEIEDKLTLYGVCMEPKQPQEGETRNHDQLNSNKASSDSKKL